MNELRVVIHAARWKPHAGTVEGCCVRLKYSVFCMEIRCDFFFYEAKFKSKSPKERQIFIYAIEPNLHC